MSIDLPWERRVGKLVKCWRGCCGVVWFGSRVPRVPCGFLRADGILRNFLAKLLNSRDRSQSVAITIYGTCHAGGDLSPLVVLLVPGYLSNNTRGVLHISKPYQGPIYHKTL